MLDDTFIGESYKMNEWSQYQNDTGWDLNPPSPADPSFVSAPNNLSLSEGSPAKGKGIA